MMVKTKEQEYLVERQVSFIYISTFLLEKSTRLCNGTLTVLNGWALLFLIWTWIYHIIHLLCQVWKKVEHQMKAICTYAVYTTLVSHNIHSASSGVFLPFLAKFYLLSVNVHWHFDKVLNLQKPCCATAPRADFWQIFLPWSYKTCATFAQRGIN